MTPITDKIASFFTKYPRKTFSKGELLVQAEENPTGVFYLEEGWVSQYDVSPNGNTVVVNLFKPVAFFPMSWAINQTPNHYFFEATTDVVAYEAPAADAVQFLKENPDVLFDLLSRVYKGTDGLLRRMAHLMGGDAMTRLRFELINAGNRFGQVQQDGSVFVPLNESELASHSGLARETVSRNLKALKAEGLVDVNHQGLVILDMIRLQTDLGSDL